MEFSQLLLRKIIEIVASTYHILKAKNTPNWIIKHFTTIPWHWQLTVLIYLYMIKIY